MTYNFVVDIVVQLRDQMSCQVNMNSSACEIVNVRACQFKTVCVYCTCLIVRTSGVWCTRVHILHPAVYTRTCTASSHVHVCVYCIQRCTRVHILHPAVYTCTYTASSCVHAYIYCIQRCMRVHILHPAVYMRTSVHPDVRIVQLFC